VNISDHLLPLCGKGYAPGLARGSFNKGQGSTKQQARLQAGVQFVAFEASASKATSMGATTGCYRIPTRIGTMAHAGICEFIPLVHCRLALYLSEPYGDFHLARRPRLGCVHAVQQA